ncbi:hypothetical protein [Pseudonocardia asaccharolytica]|uniref:Uncharacterized protein n=1 Tax=Pseudonocardia asaccharolytica DSM 44247 = NBRC 16224 TaxID=1123024 RepID=A0A511D5Y8_9PSEU|nr:hypothetical protein [Pseudonocardia asaccharolytica]GEL18348.1 hypothetical protein PA7_21850 [Pseudonocardia asaccharolytica DSM 44247 = NBRC 16224]
MSATQLEDDTDPAVCSVAGALWLIGAVAAVDVDRLPEELRSRRVQVQLDIAWARAQRRRDAAALVALLEIERSAPQVTRRNVVARDTIRRLLARARGSNGVAVRGLAHRADVAL